MRVNTAKHAPLRDVRVRGYHVDISSPSIRRFRYSGFADAARVPLTAEFDYRWDVVKSGHF